MRRATVFALLTLAGAVSAGGPPAADLPVLSVLSAQHIYALRGWQCSVAEPGAVLEMRYWHDVYGSPLRQPDLDDSRLALAAMSIPDAASAAPAIPAWKRAGAYALEFAASAVGTLIAEAGGLTTIEGVYQAGWESGTLPIFLDSMMGCMLRLCRG